MIPFGWPYTGSSPRVRGTERHQHPATSCRRFIPACAGNSSDHTSTIPVYSVHPRVCGEQARFSRFLRFIDRFIPACAGNRIGAVTLFPRSPVHPRVCGEQLPVAVVGDIRDGSSPRVRGTERAVNDGRMCLRFIPACAGNSYPPFLSRNPAAVHPRVCGEQPRWRAWNRRATGSSPRVRGTGPAP